MQLWELFLIGAALSMDAFAVSMTDGMTEPHMKPWKAILIALLFGVFQGVMPVIGYYFSSIFASLVEKIAPWLSFAILLILGGKMVIDFILGQRSGRKEVRGTGAMKLLVQAVATSIDALAVGVTFLATDTAGGLPLHIALCGLVICAITFAFSIAAVLIGRKAGDKFADKAQLIGGLVLIGIGVKILIEGLI